MRELADRAAAHGDDTTSLLLRLVALAPLNDPATAGAAGPLAAQAATNLSRAETPDAAALYSTTFVVLVATDRLDVALQAINAVLQIARRNSLLLDVSIATALRAQVNCLLGRLPEAEEDARLADRLSSAYTGRVTGGTPRPGSCTASSNAACSTKPTPSCPTAASRSRSPNS